MPDIKWIKITTEMFDDEKIRIIEAMPEADAIIVIWIRLICMAGKINAGGHLFIAPDLPYAIEELQAVVNRPLNTVKLALATFERLKMIERGENGDIFLPAFAKHQNIEGMERVRELDAARQRKRRMVLKQNPNLALNSGSNVMSRDSHAIDSDVDLEYKRDKDKNYIIIWDNVKSLIKQKVNAANFTTWFEKTTARGVTEDGCFYIECSGEVADYLEKNHRQLIERILVEVTGKELTVEFMLPEEV